MRYSIALIGLLILVSCTTAKIKGAAYKLSSSNVEIGSIGFSKATIVKNDFETHALPILNNKLRVEINILPFNKRSNKIYKEKAKYNQSQSKIQFSDSLDIKPEFVVLTIFDINGFVNEINDTQNKEVIEFLKKTEKAKITTSIVTTISPENILKIKQADTYYIVNNQESKYVLNLFKANKKIESIDLQSGEVLGYKLSKCCWSVDNRGKWYLADLVDENTSCKGKTEQKIKQRKTTKNLYKM
ncbi:MAG: hypothetical protein H7239_01555 [Flavobacterium sp.]|nr:hypothetical protein [Flavobacterium sp.]